MNFEEAKITLKHLYMCDEYVEATKKSVSNLNLGIGALGAAITATNRQFVSAVIITLFFGIGNILVLMRIHKFSKFAKEDEEKFYKLFSERTIAKDYRKNRQLAEKYNLMKEIKRECKEKKQGGKHD